MWIVRVALDRPCVVVRQRVSLATRGMTIQANALLFRSVRVRPSAPAKTGG